MKKSKVKATQSKYKSIPSKNILQINIELSLECAMETSILPQMCFTNSSEALLGLPALREALYCEGFADIRRAGPEEHGWLELNGMVVDVTRAAMARQFNAPIPKKAYYLAAKKWNRRQLRAGLLKTGGLPLYDFHTLGANPNFRGELKNIMEALATARVETGIEIHPYTSQFLPKQLLKYAKIYDS